MDLQPLYDMKSRLEQAAIAGTGLLGEDFRLRRAGEELKPLAAVSPVFGKIHQGLAGLLAAPRAEQGGLLLDLLALTDAVVYTQGVSRADGALEPLPPGPGTCLPLSYSQLNPLLAALAGKGGGRLAVIKSVQETHPAFLGDFRVLPALISGLGDSYGELAELNAQILKGLGPAPLPLLKEGFDPAGKKDMARRVEVISAIEGARATPWLREVLPQSKKSVRAAVIEALGEDQENASLLLELAQTERGAQREAVLNALAKQDSAAVRDFWRTETEQSPVRLWFLKHAPFPWVSDLAAGAFRAQLERLLSEAKITQDSLMDLYLCRRGVLGRSSPKMLDCWRWAEEQRPALSRVSRAPGVRHVDPGTALPHWLLESLQAGGAGPLCQLSLELWEKKSLPYLACALTAALLTWPAEEVYNRFAPCFQEDRPETARALLDAFTPLRWNGKAARYELSSEAGGVSHPLAQPLDLRWYGPLTRARTSGVLAHQEMSGPLTCEQTMDQVMRQLFREDLSQVREQTGVYFYHLIHNVGGGYHLEDIILLGRCGWSRWKELLSGRVTTVFVALQVLEATPLSGPEKAEVLRMLYKSVPEQNRARDWPEQTMRWKLAVWEQEVLP